MNSYAVRGWLLLAAVAALAYGGWITYRLESEDLPPPAHAAAPVATEVDREKPIRDFTLTDQTGQAFGTPDLRGQVWVASFFFASCPGTCTQLNLSLAALQQRLPADVRFVSVTCDPDNDTPQTLTRYAERFGADPDRWKFLTGEMRDLKRVGQDIFQVALEKGTHSEKAFVVDRAGLVRGRFNLLDPDEVAKLGRLINELEAGKNDEESGKKPRSHEGEDKTTDEDPAESDENTAESNGQGARARLP